MAWYDEAVFYHIYPLGLTGAPKQNDYGEPVHRLNTLIPWIDHLKRLGITALYIGPLFESVGHGYETTDYKKLDSRLGTNEDLKTFVAECHRKDIRVIFDGVFNHTGRDFFAFKDIQKNREGSAYRDWYCNVNFWGNNEYNDGFSYDNWGGYNLLVKLNQRNPAVRDYICDVIRFWVSEFDIDGIRLDAADVLDFDFMKALRGTADSVKPDFWLMGEVIHGDYSRWANAQTLHSVTNYTLHKALYSGHNDHNYFEIAHTVNYTGGMISSNIKLYNFVDNHDVERIYTKLNEKGNFEPVHILLFTLPGIPSIYYGSEFGIEGRKERYSDDSLRPYIDLKEYADAFEKNPCTKLIAALAKIHKEQPDLVNAGYQQLVLMNGHYSFARGSLIIAVNNENKEVTLNVPASAAEYTGLLRGKTVSASGGRLEIQLSPYSGEIFAPGKGEGKLIADAGEMKEEKQEAKIGKSESTQETKPEKQESIQESKLEESESTQGTKPEVKPESEQEGKSETKPEINQETQNKTKTASGQGNKTPENKTGTYDSLRDSKSEQKVDLDSVEIPDIPYEEMTIEQLQAVILSKMKKNGPVTDRMRKDVEENIWHNSLVNWAKSF